jgi:sugar lactone lactonase YvrE
VIEFLHIHSFHEYIHAADLNVSRREFRIGMESKPYRVSLIAGVLCAIVAFSGYSNPTGSTTNSGEVTTLAGTASAAAYFSKPDGVAVDSSGNVYVADSAGKLIRKITPDGVVTTLAGSGDAGHVDGLGSAASFSSPAGVAVDSSGNVYVADWPNNLIRKIAPDGVVTTLAGSGQKGHANGQGNAASFKWPAGVAVDSSGNVYVSDSANNLIRKITPNAVVTTLAGSGDAGHVDGLGSAASFNDPAGVAVDSLGNVYVSDTNNNLIRKIAPDGVVTTLAGSGQKGHADGHGSAASFWGPHGIAADSSGNVYVGDFANNLIRKIAPDGVVTSFAGSTAAGGRADGRGSEASFNGPGGVAVDSSGNVYVTDGGNNLIRKITPDGGVATLAGSGSIGRVDGRGSEASFYDPGGVGVDSFGNVYIADFNNNLIRKIAPDGLVTTLAGSGKAGHANGRGTAASFSWPDGVAVDSFGNIYVADLNNNLIRKITADAVVTTLAGSGNAGYADGRGTAAMFLYPADVAVDSSGNVYVADTDNNRIRKVSPDGVVTTLAGSGQKGHSDGAGTAASFDEPSGIAVDSSGNIYVADSGNNTIRKIQP